MRSKLSMRLMLIYAPAYDGPDRPVSPRPSLRVLRGRSPGPGRRRRDGARRGVLLDVVRRLCRVRPPAADHAEHRAAARRAARAPRVSPVARRRSRRPAGDEQGVVCRAARTVRGGGGVGGVAVNGGGRAPSRTRRARHVRGPATRSGTGWPRSRDCPWGARPGLYRRCLSSFGSTSQRNRRQLAVALVRSFRDHRRRSSRPGRFDLWAYQRCSTVFRFS